MDNTKTTDEILAEIDRQLELFEEDANESDYFLGLYNTLMGMRGFILGKRWPPIGKLEKKK